MQSLIHWLILIAGLCPFFFAISQDSPVLRNLSALSNKVADKVSSIIAFFIGSSAAQGLLSTAENKCIALQQKLWIPGVPGKYFLLADNFSYERDQLYKPYHDEKNYLLSDAAAASLWDSSATKPNPYYCPQMIMAELCPCIMN